MDDDLAEIIAARLVGRSLAEVSDPEQFSRWGTGERARDEAVEIVSAIVAGMTKELEHKERTDATRT